MCGPISVPFAALALWTQHLKALWASLAIVCFFTASYRVWCNERATRIADGRNLEHEIDGLQQQIAQVRRKPYSEALERDGRELIRRLSSNGKRLLRPDSPYVQGLGTVLLKCSGLSRFFLRKSLECERISI